jgi:hypothetical protein
VKPLNLILVSGRHFDLEQRREALARDRRLVADLATRGCVVRWLCPAEGGDPDAAVDGVTVLPVSTVVPPFRCVEGRLDDPALEMVLSRSVRSDPPDVVHALAYGAGTSINVAWLADRLGAPSVVTTTGREAFCHRGTLINERGETCSEWQRPSRCAECCLTATPDGLGGAAAVLGRVLARLQWVSPFPQGIDFKNRLELVIAGLMVARRVVVGTVEDARLLEEAGVKSVLVLEDPHEPGALMDVYQSLGAPSVRTVPGTNVQR